MLEECWTRVLELLEPEMTGISFATWIKPLIPISMDNESFTVKASSPFQKDSIYSRYADLIKASIRQVTNKDLELNVVLDEKDRKSVV